MATTTKTFSFAADAESWVATPGTSVVMQWQSGDGSPSNGCLESRVLGKNINAGQSYWEWVGTWEDLGVPASSLITEVGTGADNDYNWACTEFTTGFAIGNHTGQFELFDNTPTLQGTFSSVQGDFTTTTAWATVDGAAISVPSGIQASNSTIRLRLSSFLRTGNSTSAAVTVRQDQIILTMTYDAAVTRRIFHIS